MDLEDLSKELLSEQEVYLWGKKFNIKEYVVQTPITPEVDISDSFSMGFRYEVTGGTVSQNNIIKSFYVENCKYKTRNLLKDLGNKPLKYNNIYAQKMGTAYDLEKLSTASQEEYCKKDAETYEHINETLDKAKEEFEEVHRSRLCFVISKESYESRLKSKTLWPEALYRVEDDEYVWTDDNENLHRYPIQGDKIYDDIKDRYAFNLEIPKEIIAMVNEYNKNNKLFMAVPYEMHSDNHLIFCNVASYYVYLHPKYKNNQELIAKYMDKEFSIINRIHSIGSQEDMKYALEGCKEIYGNNILVSNIIGWDNFKIAFVNSDSLLVATTIGKSYIDSL